MTLMSLYLLCDTLCNPDGVRTSEQISSHSIRGSSGVLYALRVNPAYRSNYLAVEQPISTILVVPVQDHWDLQYVVSHNQVVDVYVPLRFDADVKAIDQSNLLPAGNGTLHASYQLAVEASGWHPSE